MRYSSGRQIPFSRFVQCGDFKGEKVLSPLLTRGEAKGCGNGAAGVCRVVVTCFDNECAQSP